MEAIPRLGIFVRESPRHGLSDGPERLAEFLDLPADGLLDAEAQQLLSSLKSRLYVSFQESVKLHHVDLGTGSRERAQ